MSDVVDDGLVQDLENRAETAETEADRLRAALEDQRVTLGAIKVHLGLAGGGVGESLEEEVRKVVAENRRLTSVMDAMEVRAKELADQNGKALVAIDDMLRAVTAERDRLALDLAELALAARPGPTAAEMDAADKASGRRRAIAKRRK